MSSTTKGFGREKLRISTVICTFSFDRISDLVEAVSVLASQTHKDDEIIVVVDTNHDLFSRLTEILPNGVKVLFSSKNGTSEARNVGIANSIGDVVAFIDDDTLPSDDWLKTIANTFRGDEECGCVTGPIFPLWRDSPPEWFTKEFWWIISCSYMPIREGKSEVRNAFGASMAFKKEVFGKAGLFSPEFGKRKGRWILADDTEFCIRMKRKTGRTVIFNSDLVVRHKIDGGRLRIRGILERAYYDGFSKSILARKYDRKAVTDETNFFHYLLKDFFPRVAKHFPSKPAKSLGQFSIAISIALAFAFGYLDSK